MESCTENSTGLKFDTEDTGLRFISQAVGKRSMRVEAALARGGGVHRSENVGMSNRKLCEIHNHRKSKVSWATDVVPGLVGPKARLKGVVDGQPVNIPALLLSYRYGRTEHDSLSALLDLR